MNNEMQTGGWLAPESKLWWPAHAMQGEPVALLSLTAIGVGGFWLAVNLSYRRFVAGTQETVSGGRASKLRSLVNGKVRFRTGLTRVLLFKEWKLIARDPQVISQTLLHLLYMLPILYLGFRTHDSTWLLVPGLILIASTLTGNLAWLTIAAEDAPQLLGTAPTAMIRLLWIKAAAAILPVSTLLMPLVIWWLLRAPWSAFLLLLCGTGGLTSAAIAQIWNPRSGNRRDMRKRNQQNIVAGLLEMLSSFGWAAVAACINGYWQWLPLALLLAMTGPVSAWLMGRAAREAALINQ